MATKPITGTATKLPASNTLYFSDVIALPAAAARQKNAVTMFAKSSSEAS